jgi:hypothetical protein
MANKPDYPPPGQQSRHDDSGKIRRAQQDRQDPPEGIDWNGDPDQRGGEIARSPHGNDMKRMDHQQRQPKALRFLIDAPRPPNH